MCDRLFLVYSIETIGCGQVVSVYCTRALKRAVQRSQKFILHESFIYTMGGAC